jgi:hypothetical protein
MTRLTTLLRSKLVLINTTPFLVPRSVVNTLISLWPTLKRKFVTSLRATGSESAVFIFEIRIKSKTLKLRIRLTKITSLNSLKA